MKKEDENMQVNAKTDIPAEPGFYYVRTMASAGIFLLVRGGGWLGPDGEPPPFRAGDLFARVPMPYQWLLDDRPEPPPVPTVLE